MDRDTAWETLVPDGDLRDWINAADDLLRELVRERGWPEEILENLYPLHFAALLSPYAHLRVEYPGLLLPYDDSVPGPALASCGYLLIGSCPNGDWIAVDCERRAGSVVYVSHEEFDPEDAGDVESITRTVAPTVSAYLLALNENRAPLDYFDDPTGAPG